MESVEGEKVLVSAKEAEVVENIAEIEKDLKVQEGVICRNCDAPMTPGHQCELESDEIEVEDEEKRTTESEEESEPENDEILLKERDRLRKLVAAKVQKLLDEGRKPKCPNCEELFSSGHHSVTHQC